jgi:rare lipoprotein A
MGTRVRVTELRSGRSVVVQITDRGPFLPDRGIDLSFAAARQLGIVHRGVARVRVELLTDTPPLIATACNGPISSWLPKAIVE